MAEDFDFRQWLEITGLPLVQAAERLGVSFSYAQMMTRDPVKSGYRKPTPRIIARCREIAYERADEIRKAAEEWG